jgi:hypothetical protein
MNLHDLAKEIEAAQRKKRLEARGKLWRPAATTATDLGYRCLRRIVYHRTVPERAAPISEGLASIFEEGNLHERDIRRELSELGWEVVESDVHFRDDRLEISGVIDGMIKAADPTSRFGWRKVPVEIKSCGGDPPKTEEALAGHWGLYGRYYCQMQSYLFLLDSIWS